MVKKTATLITATMKEEKMSYRNILLSKPKVGSKRKGKKKERIWLYEVGHRCKAQITLIYQKIQSQQKMLKNQKTERTTEAASSSCQLSLSQVLFCFNANMAGFCPVCRAGTRTHRQRQLSQIFL